jgi:hypothetical protein
VEVKERADTKRGLSDVKLAGDWLDIWLTRLDELEMKTYLELAHFYNTRTYHDANELRMIFGDKSTEVIRDTLQSLESFGLIEIIHKEGKFHYHFLHMDAEGFHRAGRVKPSIKEALTFHDQIMEELIEVTSQDETPELRKKYFEKYPALQDEYEFWKKNRDEDTPAWRLWMELSIFLMSQFEERYGILKEEHAEIFKESSVEVLRLHLDIIDRITRDILERKAEIFPAVSDHWVVGIDEGKFIGLPMVQRLAHKYRIGPEQIYLNTLEALQQAGLTLVDLDEDGNLINLFLPTSTGLDPEEERLLYIRCDEFSPDEQRELDETLKKIKKVRQKYVRYLATCGIRAMMNFIKHGKVEDIDFLLELITDRVNDAIDLLREEREGEETAFEPISLQYTIDRYNKLHATGKSTG